MAALALARQEPDCSRCDDAMVVRVMADRNSSLFGVAVPCTCVPLVERAAQAGIPERYRDARLATMLRLPRKLGCIEWGERWNGRGSAVIASLAGAEDETYGTGKTHLVCALLVGQIELGRPARFVDVSDYLDEIKTRFDGGEEQAEAYCARLAAEPLLALDDVSEQRLTTPWQRQQVATLVDRRYRSQRPTLLTTNWTALGQLEAALGGALASRLRSFDWIPMGGEDLRGVDRR